MLMNAMKTADWRSTISEGVPRSDTKNRAVINNIVVALADGKREEEKA